MEAAIFSWLILSVLVGFMGSRVKLGFAGGFLLSLILSPLIGFIFVLASKSKDEELRDQQMLKNQNAQLNALQNINQTQVSMADELQKLKTLHESGALTLEEYQEAKQQVIGKTPLK